MQALGMTLLDRFDFQDMAFSLYFLGYADACKIPADRKERAKWMFSQPAVRSPIPSQSVGECPVYPVPDPHLTLFIYFADDRAHS